MAAQTEFETLLEDVVSELQPVCRELRAVVTKLHPEFVEVIWPKQRIVSYGVGPKKMSEHYVYIAPQARHVNLGLYYGAIAVDPTGLLEGTGKMLRHVKIRSVAEAKSAPLRQLVVDAIAERKDFCS
jgi:hypothetical protein